MARLPLRTALRKLAIAAGLLEASEETFDMQSKELVELLDKKYPGMADGKFKTADVRKMIADIEAGRTDDDDDDDDDEDEEEEKPKKKAPARRGRGRRGRKKPEEEEEASEEEEEDEDEEEAEEEPKPTRLGRRGRGRKKPEPEAQEEEAEPEPEKPKRGRRGRGRAKTSPDPAEPEAEKQAPAAAATTAALDEIKAEIGKVSKKLGSKVEKKQVDALTEAVSGLEAKVAAMATYIEALVLATTDIYNDGVEDEDDKLDSIVELLEGN